MELFYLPCKRKGIRLHPQRRGSKNTFQASMWDVGYYSHFGKTQCATFSSLLQLETSRRILVDKLNRKWICLQFSLRKSGLIYRKRARWFLVYLLIFWFVLSPAFENFILCSRHRCVSQILDAAQVQSVVSRQPPHVNNFEFCLSCRKSHFMMAPPFLDSLHLVTDCGRYIKTQSFWSNVRCAYFQTFASLSHSSISFSAQFC